MAEIGQDIKTERLKQGLTLQDVFARTRISAGVITNLEEGNYDRIGTPLLVRSFMRTYCTALGVDPGPILDRHAAEIVACDRQMEGIKEYRRLTRAFSSRKRKLITILAALTIMVIGSMVAAAWIAQKRANFTLSQTATKEIIPKEELPSDLPRNSTAIQGPRQQAEWAASSSRTERKPIVAPETKDQAASPNAQENIALPAGAPSNQSGREAKTDGPEIVAATPGESPGEAGTSEGLNVSQNKDHLPPAKAPQEVWVQVKTDNAKTVNLMMKPGEKKELVVEKKVQIVVGNAGGLSLQWDGKTRPPSGKAGAVVRLQLPKSKLTE
jgi:cytoskeleton protein RodZ